MIPRAVQSALLAALAVASGACTSNDIYGQRTSGASTGRGVAGTGTGTSGGTSGGTTTGLAGCNPNPASCPGFGSPDPLNTCSDGLVELVANLVEFNFQSTPTTITCPLELDDLNDPSVVVVTDQCGYLHHCAPAATHISLTTQNAPNGYVPMNFATVLMNAPAQIPNRPGIPMVKGTVVGSLKQVLPDAIPTDAMVIVNVETLEPTGCTAKDGWSLGLVDGHGDPVDAGVAYVVSGLPTTQASNTDMSGIAFFYNVDPSLVQVVSPRGEKNGNHLPDGGLLCGNPEQGPPLGLTGSVEVSPGVISVIPYVVAQAKQ